MSTQRGHVSLFVLNAKTLVSITLMLTSTVMPKNVIEYVGINIFS